MSHNLRLSLSQWFFGSTGQGEIVRWSPLRRLLFFTLALGLIYIFCWLLFQFITPPYRRALAQSAEGYYSLIGHRFEFLVVADQLTFRSYQRPVFEADLSISGLAANVPFLLSLMLATPGLLLKNRMLRLTIGLFLLFLTQVLFLVTKVEVSLLAAAHPLAGSALFWNGLDNFLEITGKSLSPILIWLFFCLSYLRGTVESAQEARTLQKVGRNQPCPCGSGKKYKHCCARRVPLGVNKFNG